ncbi:MAG: hypothetical protein KDB54_03965 [Solirubrobacterales bacterium]|nr:hypothetical protein [Solirubrobacterales bacterium]MCB0859789.1 hypothetical protein [Solirubrobacterales bacterium]HRV59571.1 hypothetical protein [Solirubrobacterales bacterium]
MWIVTDRGFFSVVDKGEPEGCLCVRARVREDLEHLCRLESLTSYANSIEESELSDYRYRIHVKREDWVKAAADLAGRIDYDNFKNAVAARQGREREGYYSKVWLTLLGMQR